jgi:hypothetical protein
MTPGGWLFSDPDAAFENLQVFVLQKFPRNQSFARPSTVLTDPA